MLINVFTRFRKNERSFELRHAPNSRLNLQKFKNETQNRFIFSHKDRKIDGGKLDEVLPGLRPLSVPSDMTPIRFNASNLSKISQFLIYLLFFSFFLINFSAKIMELAKTKAGSSGLQSIMNPKRMEKQKFYMIYRGLLEKLVDYSLDENAYRIIIKCIEWTPDSELAAIWQEFSKEGTLEKMFNSQYGAQVLQSLLVRHPSFIKGKYLQISMMKGSAPTLQQIIEKENAQNIQSVQSQLSGHIVELSKDPNSQLVLSSLIERISTPEVILKEIKDQGEFQNLLKHKNGAAVIYSIMKNDIHLLVDKINGLARSRNGSIILTKLITEVKDPIVSEVVLKEVQDLLDLSCHKYGNLLVKHLMLNLSKKQTNNIWDQFLEEDNFETLLNNEYGIQVIGGMMERDIRVFANSFPRILSKNGGSEALISILKKKKDTEIPEFVWNALQNNLGIILNNPKICDLMMQCMDVVSVERRRIMSTAIYRNFDTYDASPYGVKIIEMLKGHDPDVAIIGEYINSL